MNTSGATTSMLPECLRFGRFELWPREHRLLADGQPITLGGRAFDLLLALVQRAGQLVTRHELIDQVWPGRVVEENNLSVQINALRKVLDEEWLITVPGRGYRFVAPVQSSAADAVASEPATPAKTPSLRTHLPTQLALLVGRSDDLAALGTLIDQHRLVSVVGAGGMGKTRLAQALLQLRANTYSESSCWVELGPVRDRATLPVAVAAALEVPLAPGDALLQLAKAIRGMQILIALDNAEHLLEDVAHLAQALLDAAPGLRLVVTSQAPLRLSLERVLRLGPMAVPQGTLPAQQAQSFGAVALFCQSAAAADHRFELRDADVPAVIELCRRLDGLALAIELAAARAPTLGLAQLLDAVADRLQVFNRNRNRLAPARQQSLRATLEWSVSLLAPPEKQLFRRLGMVAGCATLEMVQQLGADLHNPSASDPWAVVDALDQLVQRSLVEVRNTEETSPPLYRLLESPRALALEQLTLAGEDSLVRRQHALAVLEAFEAAERSMLSGALSVAQWRREGEPLFADLQQALAWARSAGHQALALGLAAALLSRVPDPRHVDTREAVQTCESLLDTAEDADHRRACQAWLAVSLVTALGPQRSQQATTRALQRLQQLGSTDQDRFIRYGTLCEAARVRAAGGQLDDAVTLLDEAEALEDPAWPPVRRRMAQRARAFVARAQHRPDLALHHLRQTLSLSLAAGDPSLATRLNMADFELLAGDAVAAVATGRGLLEALASKRATGLLQLARLNLAAAHLRLQQTREARELLQTTWHTSRSFGPDWPQLAQCLGLMASLCAAEGRPESTARMLGATEAQIDATAHQRAADELQAHERSTALAKTALGESAFDRLRDEGRCLTDAELADLAFGDA